MTASEPHHFSIGRSLAFSAVIVVLFFGIVELVLRVVGVQPPVRPRLILEVMDTDITLPFMRADPDVFWSPVPGFRAPFMGKMVSINTLGLRGEEVALPKPQGIRRLVCFGDSITFGYGVADVEAYPSALGRELAQDGWDVVNAGVTGYTSHQVRGWLRRLAPLLQADAATFLIGWNDGNRRAVDDREYERRIHAITALEGSLDHLYLYRALKGAYLRATVLKGIQWTRNAKGHRASLDQYRENLEAIVAECRRSGIRPVFVALPHRLKAGEPPFGSEYGEMLVATARAQGVPLLDCGPLGLQSASPSNAEYFLDSLHLTPRGNALMAHEIARQLRDLGIVTASSSGRSSD
ncbi:MAG TPA: GDSL-type esterase/lipase family protein [Vicinamibacteria bacterium]|jgi:lysophospholipase L1-like esterase|nr:GDSL-type esterase/lipase family protein [Vicinamibacteria bacterium]